MKGLVLGKGEIGTSLFNILSPRYPTEIIDKGEEAIGEFDILHVCFPYSSEFEDQVFKYTDKYKPKQIVIHSTVPVGTTSKLNAVHSPVVGLHPHLEESLKTFTKFLGGKNASEVADYFRRAGIKVYLTDKSETTEYFKIMSTTFYGIMIEFHKKVLEDCREMNLPFEFFTIWNRNYNEGYEKLGYPEYKKPLLVPIMTIQKGHCTLPNCELITNEFTELIKRRNGKCL